MGKYLKRLVSVLIIGLLMGIPGGPPVWAQAPMADSAPPPSQAQLEDLVGRIALYPDDLVAIILPASTYPLQIVQADRFLQKLKQDKNLQPDPSWDESVRNLLNYPEVISMMSQDLEWTQDLGEVVVSSQAAVLQAIQGFRARAQKAGNLKSDDKQQVVEDKSEGKTVIQIVPANPEVIYVPQYNPAQVVVYASVPPPPVYYPTPYPVYYYPYPAGAAFATGFFFGAATAWACGWGGGHIENNVNINNTRNFNTARVNPQNQARVDQARQQAQQRQQTGTAQNRQQGQGARGQGGSGSNWQSSKRPGDVSQGRVSSRPADRPGSSAGGAGSRGEFGDPGRGSAATRDASRGSQSRGGGDFTSNRGASASTMDRGGANRGGASASTMDRGSGARSSSGGSGMSSGGARGGGGGGFSGGGGGARGGGGGGARGGGGGRGGGRR